MFMKKGKHRTTKSLRVLEVGKKVFVGVKYVHRTTQSDGEATFSEWIPAFDFLPTGNRRNRLEEVQNQKLFRSLLKVPM